MRPGIAGTGRQATLEFPHRPRVVEARFIEGTAATLAKLERLVSLDALAHDPLADEAGVFPITNAAFGKRGATGR